MKYQNIIIGSGPTGIIAAEEMLNFRRARLQDGAVEQPVHRLPPAIRVLQSAAAGEPAQHA